MKETTVVWAKLFLIFIISAKPLGLKADSNECKLLGNNSCRNNSECCSGFCFMETGWEFGVCKIPKGPEKPNKSIPENNKDKSNSNSNSNSYEESNEQNNRVHDEGDDVFEKGICAYYKGRNTTTNGDIFDENEMTAAHATLPFNTMVKVETMGSYVVVKINDRKRRLDGLVLLLSRAAAETININERTGPVPCQLKYSTGLNCKISYGEPCVMHHECCSHYCLKDIFSVKGICVPE